MLTPTPPPITAASKATPTLPAAICGIDTGKTHVAAIIPTEAFRPPDQPRRRPPWHTAGTTLHLANTAADYQTLIQTLPPGTPVFIEPTGYYATAITQYLQATHPIYWIAGKATKDARHRFFNINNKSDKIDARCLAAIGFYHLAHGDYPVTPAPSDDALDLTLSLLCRQHYQATKETTRTINRVRQLMLAVWPEAEPYTEQLIGSPTNGHTRPNLIAHYTPAQIAALPGPELARNFRTAPQRTLIRRLAATTIGHPGPHLQAILADLSNQYQYHVTHALQLQATLTHLVATHPLHPILSTLPALGPVQIAVLCSAIKDAALHPTKQHLRVALGCYCETQQSGTTLDQTKAGPKGNRLAKRCLHLYAMTLIRLHSGAVYTTFDRRRRSARKHNLANARRQLCDIIWSMLYHNQPYDSARRERQPPPGRGYPGRDSAPPLAQGPGVHPALDSSEQTC